MAAIGGSYESVSIFGRIFAVAADADVSRKLGGKTNEVQPNGDGSARLIQTRTTWELSGINLVIDHDRGDAEYLQGIADGKVFGEIAATEAGDVTWQGTGTITGDLAGSSMTATCPVTLSGPGKLTQQ